MFRCLRDEGLESRSRLGIKQNPDLRRSSGVPALRGLVGWLLKVFLRRFLELQDIFPTSDFPALVDLLDDGHCVSVTSQSRSRRAGRLLACALMPRRPISRTTRREFLCIASIPKNHFLRNRDFRRISQADQKLGRAENARKCHKRAGWSAGARRELTGRRADAIQGV